MVAHCMMLLQCPLLAARYLLHDWSMYERTLYDLLQPKFLAARYQLHYCLSGCTSWHALMAANVMHIHSYSQLLVSVHANQGGVLCHGTHSLHWCICSLGKVHSTLCILAVVLCCIHITSPDVAAASCDLLHVWHECYSDTPSVTVHWQTRRVTNASHTSC